MKLNGISTYAKYICAAAWITCTLQTTYQLVLELIIIAIIQVAYYFKRKHCLHVITVQIKLMISLTSSHYIFEHCNHEFKFFCSVHRKDITIKWSFEMRKKFKKMVIRWQNKEFPSILIKIASSLYELTFILMRSLCSLVSLAIVHHSSGIDVRYSIEVFILSHNWHNYEIYRT